MTSSGSKTVTDVLSSVAATMLRAVWDHRHFVAASVRRELEARYQRSLGGAAWLVLQPLATIAIYALVFSSLMRAAPPGIDSVFAYALFVCAGVLAWTYFSEVISRLATVFVDNGNLLKNGRFPRSCLPVIVACVATINFCVVAALFAGLLVLAGRAPSSMALAVFPVMIVQTALAIGLGLILGTLNVFFRDVAQVMPTLLQFWFWLTPIVYPISVLPAWLRDWIALNPLTPVMTAYQRALFTGEAPDWGALGAVALLAVCLLLVASALFRAKSGELVDEL